MAARNFCSACGSPLDGGAAFCGNCGVRIPDREPQMAAQQVPAVQQKTEPASGTTLPAYGGTLFGNIPTSSREMFSSTFGDEETSEREWYEQTWFVVLLLILFWIIGVILLWRSKFFTTGQKLAFSIITFFVDWFLLVFIRVLIVQMLLSPSTGLKSSYSIQNPASENGAQSSISSTQAPPHEKWNQSIYAPSEEQRGRIDFAKPIDVYGAIGVVREGCLSRGNNYCAALCEKYQEAVINLNQALTQSYIIDPNTREPEYASNFQSYYRGCAAAANN